MPRWPKSSTKQTTSTPSTKGPLIVEKSQVLPGDHKLFRSLKNNNDSCQVGASTSSHWLIDCLTFNVPSPQHHGKKFFKVNWCGSSSKILNHGSRHWVVGPTLQNRIAAKSGLLVTCKGFRSKGWSFFEGKSDKMKPQCIQCSSSAPIYLSHKRWDGLRKILHNNSQRHHIHKISTEYIWILEHGRSFLEGS